MPLGSARLTLFAKPTVAVEAEVIRKKIGVSALGNAQVDTAQSQFGGASALFDGTGDYLDSPTSSNLILPVNEDFTIEGWIRPSATTGVQVIATDRNGSLSGSKWDISMWSGSYLVTRTATLLFESGSGAGSIIVISDNNVFTTNTWHHFAVVRSSNEIYLYVDGVDVTNNRAGTRSAAIGSGNLSIGMNPGDAVNTFAGHIDEFRWSDTARYTTGFTPQTAPFVNDDNTKLLLHMNGTDGSTFFEDDNGTGRAQVGVIGNGNAQIDNVQSYFGSTSMLFDGTGDILTANIPAIGTGDFTFEAFVRLNTKSKQGIFALSDGSQDIFILLDTNNNYGFLLYSPNVSPSVLDALSGGVGYAATNASQWYHIAVTREGTSVKLWLDGSLMESGTSSANFDGVNLIIGSESGVAYWNGWMDEVRVSTVARYTGSSYSVPTSAFVNDSDTVLLLHGNGTDGSTDFRDDNGTGRSSVGVSALGNAQVDTAISNFGGSSLLLDGTGDYLDMDPNWTVGSSDDFTVEQWIYQDNYSATYDFCRMTDGGSSKIVIFISSSEVLNVLVNGSTIYSLNNTQHPLNLTTWHHVALTRSSGTIRLFIDGTQYGSDVSNSADLGTIDRYTIGWNQSTGSPAYFDGNIDEVRISNTARYTSGFTAPTAPFQNDANTTLLLHMDGTDGSTTFIDDNGTTP